MRTVQAHLTSMHVLLPVQDFVQRLNLQPGQRVLDIGCGIGGGDFFMASKYGATVHGIDQSVNMVLIALERASTHNSGHKVGQSVCIISDSLEFIEMMHGARVDWDHAWRHPAASRNESISSGFAEAEQASKIMLVSSALL